MAAMTGNSQIQTHIFIENELQRKVRKYLDSRQQYNERKLRGLFISKGYAKIIHIGNYERDFHMNSFARFENKNSLQQKAGGCF